MSGTTAFIFISLTAAAAASLTILSWRRRAVTGFGSFAALSLVGCLLALTEILSMLASTPETALFWFKTRFLFVTTLPVFWLLFVLRYRGLTKWLTRKIRIGLFLVPLLSQIAVWSNDVLGFWVQKEAAFFRDGPFWLADTSARISNFWFLVHLFYSLSLTLIGLFLMAALAWRLKHRYFVLALLLSGGAFSLFVILLIPSFDQAAVLGFNPFTLGVGLSLSVVALAIFKFMGAHEVSEKAVKANQSIPDQSSMGSPAPLILIFVLLFSGIATVGVLSFRNYKDSVRDQAKKQLEAISRLKTDELHRWREERLGDARILHRNPSFGALVRRFLGHPGDKRKKAELQSWLSEFTASRNYERIYLIDGYAVERFSTSVSELPVPEHLRREMKDILKAGKPVFFDFHRHESGGSIHLSIVIPFPDRGTRREPVLPEGCLIFVIDPAAFLYPYLRQWPVPSRTAETLLVRREGDEVVFLNPLRFRKDSALNLKFPLSRKDLPAARAVMGEKGLVEGKDYRGVPVLSALSAVPGSPWFLISRMDLAEIDAPLRKRLWQQLVFLGVIMLLFMMLLGNFWMVQRERFFRSRDESTRALQESLARFELANRATYDVIWDWNLRTGNLWWNDNFHRALGYEAAEIGPDYAFWCSLVHPEDIDRVDKSLKAAIDSGKIFWSNDYRLKRKDGVYADIEDRGFISRDENGFPVRMIGAMRDISERRKTEEALHESEERYRRLLEQAPVGIAVVSDGKIAFANPSGARFLGEDSGDRLVGRPVEEVLHPSVRGKGMERLGKLLDGEPVDYPAETVFVKKDGSAVSAQVMIAPLIYKGRPAIQIIAVDITERKRAEEELRSAHAEMRRLLDEAVRSRRALLSMIEDQKIAEDEIRTLNAGLEERVRRRTAQLEAANKELEAFTYSVSHDLRAPLRAVNGYTRILLEDYEPNLDEEGRRICGVISDSARSMGQLIDDLLALSRFGHAEIKSSPIDMKTMANSIFFEVTTPEIRGRIDFRPGDLPDAFGDPSLMRQVWINLLSNAVKFSSKRERALIEVEGAQTDDECIYSVKDNGVGFDMQYVHKLFGVFQRLHGDREFTGTGVGLAIVQRIVHRHGGRVWAEGEIDGGAVFHFALRRKEA